FDNVKILVVPDRPPKANDDGAATPPGGFVNIDVLENDTSQDGSPLRLVDYTFPAHGRLETTPGTSILSYFPTVGFLGEDSFTYTIQDAHGQSATGTVRILVENPPEADSATFLIEDYAPFESPLSLISGYSSTGDGRHLTPADARAVLVTPPVDGRLDFRED